MKTLFRLGSLCCSLIQRSANYSRCAQLISARAPPRPLIDMGANITRRREKEKRGNASVSGYLPLVAEVDTARYIGKAKL